MHVRRTAVLGLAALTGLATLAGTAQALTTVTIDKCLAAQIKIVRKGAAATTGCYAKAASKGLPVDGECLSKASVKITSGLDKLDAKQVCLVEGTSAARQTNNASFGTKIDSTVGNAPKKCDAAKTKAVGKYVAALTGCFSKAAGKTGTVDSACVSKAVGKLAAAVAKAEEGDDCSHLGQAAKLQNDASSFAESETCALQGGGPACAPCGNGLNDPGEPCDASASPAGWEQCGPEFTCTACNCACPTTVVFSGDANAPETILDTGWTGISHRTPIIGNGDVTVQLSSCTGTTRPCGTCQVSGPVANPDAGAGQLDSQRCSTDSSKKCTSDAVCIARTCLGGANHGASCANDSECPAGTCPAAGVCNFYFGSNLALSAGSVALCVVNQFAAPVSGTANVESGEASTTVLLTSRVYLGPAVDVPCPRCSDNGGINDGTNGGTCDGGPRVGLACDANGAVPGRPDFGRTSLDCPPVQGALAATLGIDLSNATDTVAKTLTVNSPNCSGTPGEKCLCDSCNNGNAEACDDNADCPDPAGPIGPICGGRRCLGGPNAGAACGANSVCPGGGVCVRPGEPTRSTPCLDDTSIPNRVLECADADGDGEGACTIGPIAQTCTLASGHAQRACTSIMNCGGAPGSCDSHLRNCFLTGGGTFQPLGSNDGTDSLVAVGIEDPPVVDVSNPTLAAVFCVGPTASGAVNNVMGLPGPGRVTIKGLAVGHP